jgi:hypothetical protein
MSKTQVSEAINLASQTIPFLMITATFIIIAYVYGHTLTPPTDNVFESSKITFSHFL